MVMWVLYISFSIFLYVGCLFHHIAFLRTFHYVIAAMPFLEIYNVRLFGHGNFTSLSKFYVDAITLKLLLFWWISGLSLAPLVVNVDPNVNVIVTACLTVFVGCYRSVKPTPPSVYLVYSKLQLRFFSDLFWCHLNIFYCCFPGNNV